MPTCAVSSLRRPGLYCTSHHNLGLVLVAVSKAGSSSASADALRAGRRKPRKAGFATTAAAARHDDATLPTVRRTLTVLHKARSLVPRILPPASQAEQAAESLELWQELLAGAHEDLSPSRAKVIRVAVYGCDDLSRARDLVTALLEDPFSSDSQKEAVRTRWNSVDSNAREIFLQATPTQQSGTVQLRSSWLHRFDGPIQVNELKPPATPSSWSHLDQTTLKRLFAADISIIVCNPISTHLQALVSSSSGRPLLTKRSNVVLAITATANSTASEEYVQSLRDRGSKTLFIDPARALTALEIINLAPSSPLAVQRYQDDFESSNIARLTQLVASIVSISTSSSGLSGDVVLAVHTQTARSLIQDSLLACHSVLKCAERDVVSIRDHISKLEDTAEEAKAKVAREVFGARGGNESGDVIQKAVREAKDDVQRVMNDLSWWKLIWRVDDVREIVGSAIYGAWCKDLEQTLAFHAGRLAFLQHSTEKLAKSVLASLPPSSTFRSPLLENRLQQLSSALSYPLDAAAFSAPLHSRREQLKWPTARLHAAAQQSVITMTGSTFGGLGIAWAGWASHLGLFDIGMQMETAVGAGLLGAVAGVRWAIGRFEKAKRRWWRDWDRVGEGLERDLRATLDRTMDERVFVVSKTAASGLRELAEKRQHEVEELQHEVFVLEDELHSSSQ